MSKMSKKLKAALAVVVVILVIILGFKCFNRIQPGYVGIVYNLKGGIEDDILAQGLHFVSPLKRVNSYSVATEQAYLSKDSKEGSRDDDSFTIPTSDGKTVSVDLEFAYHFDSEVLPKTFTTFKGQSGKTIEETFIRGKMKAWTSEVSSTFSVIDIYGEKRAQLNSAVLEHTKKKFNEYGIIIDSVNFSRIGLDEKTEEAIQVRINKQQELETAKLETQKATLEAEKKKIQAEADAKAKIIEAEAQAKANKLLEQSITNELIRMKEAEARLKHGWVTVQGADAIVVDKNKEK